MINKKHQPTLAREGLSLVEIMIAMVMTLIILGAMMAAFSYGSAEMQKGRASIELNNRLISAEEQLRRDLDRITVELKPHHTLPTLPKGYVEIVDGPEIDYIAANDSVNTAFSHNGNELVFGDRDDYFACTIKSDGKAFRGRNGNNIVESHFAEVAWFSIQNPGVTIAPGSAADEMVVRRQLLIIPSLGTLLTAPTDAAINNFFARNDISARIEFNSGVRLLVANSLTDLAIRGNRFCHTNPAATSPQLSTLNTALLPLRSNQNHVMFTSAAAFDVQLFDPNATNFVVPDAAGSNIQDIAEPSDIGPREGLMTSVPGVYGAYVDLGKAPEVVRTPAGFGNFPFTSTPAYTEAVYDTGTSQYNRDTANDFGANGVDNGGDIGVVDDNREQDAATPYNAAIRGLKFTMRVLEPVTKQVRQITVKKSFLAN